MEKELVIEEMNEFSATLKGEHPDVVEEEPDDEPNLGERRIDRRHVPVVDAGPGVIP